MKRKPVKIGLIGGGLMGREMVGAFARWRALTDVSVEPQLVAVADLNPSALEWFDDGHTLLTRDYRELLARSDIETFYVAVPHHLHAKIYCEVLEAGKDLLAEKPFGIDLGAAEKIAETATATKRFVRCSSEFPFFPGAQRAIQVLRSGQLGSGARGGFRPSPFERPRPDEDGQLETSKRHVRRDWGAWGSRSARVSCSAQAELVPGARVRPTPKGLPRTARRQRRHGGLRHLG